MTVTIQEKSAAAKDLYFKSPVVVQEYDANIDEYKKYSMEEQVARSWISKNHQFWKRIRYKIWFDDYKAQTFRCVICKNNDPIILDFHHVDPHKKKYNIPTMINQCMKLRDIQAELKKCVAVCSNCHRRITENSIPYDEVVEKAEKEYSEYYGPGENMLEDFAALMLEHINPVVVYKYDDVYIRSYRIRQNFYDHQFRSHPDYINFFRKYIVSKESDYDLGLEDDDELGEFNGSNQ